MTDLELLEAAAKAAGMVVVSDYDGQTWAHLADEHPEQAARWNPLDDDGDALRLGMSLNIDVQFNTDEDEQTTSAIAPSPERPMSGEGWSFTEGWRGDKGSATRRAIVRAAAEIGKKVDSPQEWAN